MEDIAKEKTTYEERSTRTKHAKLSEGLNISSTETLFSEEFQGYAERNRNVNLVIKDTLEHIYEEMKATAEEKVIHEEWSLETKLRKPDKGLDISHAETLSCKDFQGFAERNRNVCLLSKADLEQIQKEITNIAKEEAIYEERSLKTKLGKPSGLGTSYMETPPCKDFQGYEERNRNASLISEADLEQIQKEIKDTAKEEAIYEERSLENESLYGPSEGLGTSHIETLPCKDSSRL
ncbi:hypothetical protein KIN20_034503 [Parelaphostrongylus tenuis]|uniref:Uncharacterized protein n=1 Tax=Parelaphostrongylus tenuis TaxID=148309 RepID=A0AAD5WJ16_PARTN|nr:hypothetical protein KIN20_034503 [Parelaphostrongylus tenuis]